MSTLKQGKRAEWRREEEGLGIGQEDHEAERNH